MDVDLWSVALSVSTYTVALTLIWAMRLSSRFRHAFAGAMPDRVRDALVSLYYGMWLVIALFLCGSTARLVLAIVGPNNLLASMATGLTTSLALSVAWNIALACWRLHRSL